MRTLFLTLLCLCASLAQSANYVTVTNTFTNRTVVGDSFTRASTTVIFTNAPINNQAWIVTNSAKASATNLWRFLGRTAPSLYVRMADETNVVISGTDLQFSISGGFGFLTTNTAATTNQWFASLPFDVLTAANKTNQADAILDGLLKYPRTNAFPQGAQAMTNFVSRTNAQEVLNKTIGTSLLTNSTVDFSVLTNIPRANIGLLIGTNFYAFSGVVSNVDLINVLSLSGIATALTNGTLYGTSGTNMPWLNATNANLGTARIDTLTVWTGLISTNFSSPGTGLNSEKLGSGALASGVNSLALGVNTEAIGAQASALGNSSVADENGTALGTTAVASTNSVAIGYLSKAGIDGGGGYFLNATALGSGAQAKHDNSTAVGYGTQTTASNQVRLGSAISYVSIPGRLESSSGYISSIVGSNTLYGTLELKAGTVSTLVNGNNAGIILSTNPVVELSGATTIAQIAGFAASRDGDTRLLRFTGAITNWIVNEANSVFSTDGTAANRIVTGTGGDLTQTNQPAWLKMRYRAASSRWEVLDYSR